MNRAARRALMQVMHRRQTVVVLITACIGAISFATWALVRLVADAPRRDAELEVVVAAPSGHPPTRGVAAFLPDEGSTQTWRSEALLDDHGRSVLRARAGASGTVFVRGLGLADWRSGAFVVPADGRRFDVTLAPGLSVDGVVEPRIPPGPASLVVEDRTPELHRAQRPWLPAHVAIDVPRGATMDHDARGSAWRRMPRRPQRAGIWWWRAPSANASAASQS